MDKKGKIYIGEVELSINLDQELDSGSTNAVVNSAITAGLDTKLDKVNFLNQIYPQGAIYITESNTNPSTFIGGTWELVNVNGKKKTLWSGSQSSNTTINLTGGSISDFDMIEVTFTAANQFGVSYFVEVDTLKASTNYIFPISWDGGINRYSYIGSITDTSFSITFGNQTTLTKVRGINLGLEGVAEYVWRRTDDSPVMEQIVPYTYKRIKDVLWSGNTGSGSITLSASINNYDAIEFTVSTGTYNVVYVLEKDKVVNNCLIPVSWDSTNRYLYFTNVASTSLSFDSGNCTLLMVRGIKGAYAADASDKPKVVKLNPTFEWTYPTIQTDNGTELWEETLGTHHKIYGYIICLWSGGGTNAGQSLDFGVISGIHLPTQAIGGTEVLTHSTQGTANGGGTITIMPNGHMFDCSPFGRSSLSGFQYNCRVEWEWDD